MARRRRIVENLQIKAAVAEQLQDRGRLRKQVTMKPPLGREREYLKALRRILKIQRRIVEHLFVSQLPAISSAALDSVIVVDGYGDDIERAMRNVRLRFVTEVSEDDIAEVAGQAGRQIEMFSANQVNRTFESAIGIPVDSLFPGANEAIEAFTKDNVRLITSISEQYFDQVETTALRNLRAGRRFSEWKGELVERFKVSERRAALIARDQTNKFNGELNKARQQSLGIRTYTWRTVGDERVRPTHEEINGNTYAWEGNPKPPEGHPGEPINCRCSAEPNIESALTGTEKAAVGRS